MTNNQVAAFVMAQAAMLNAAVAECQAHNVRDPKKCARDLAGLQQSFEGVLSENAMVHMFAEASDT